MPIRIKRSSLQTAAVFALTLTMTISIGLNLKGLLFCLFVIAVGFGLYRASIFANRARIAIKGVTEEIGQSKESWNQLYGILINQPRFRWLEEHWKSIVWAITIPAILIFMPAQQLLLLSCGLMIIVLVSSAQTTQSSLKEKVIMPKSFNPAEPPPPIQPSKVALILYPLQDHPELCAWAPILCIGLYIVFKVNLLSKILFFGPKILSIFPMGMVITTLMILLTIIPWVYFWIIVWKGYETYIDPDNQKVCTSMPKGWTQPGERSTASTDINIIKESSDETKVLMFFKWIILYVWTQWNPSTAMNSSENVHQALVPAWWVLWFEAYRNFIASK